MNSAGPHRGPINPGLTVGRIFFVAPLLKLDLTPDGLSRLYPAPGQLSAHCRVHVVAEEAAKSTLQLASADHLS